MNDYKNSYIVSYQFNMELLFQKFYYRGKFFYCWWLRFLWLYFETALNLKKKNIFNLLLFLFLQISNIFQ